GTVTLNIVPAVTPPKRASPSTTVESLVAHQTGTRMKRSAARAGQLSRASAAISRRGAVHSLSHITAADLGRAGMDPGSNRATQSRAAASQGALLTRAVATR